MNRVIRAGWVLALWVFGLLTGLAARNGQLSADDWPQWRGPTRDDVWKETGLVERFAGPRLPVRWRVDLGSGYSGPTVAEGRVYVTDRQGKPSRREARSLRCQTRT